MQGHDPFAQEVSAEHHGANLHTKNQEEPTLLSSDGCGKGFSGYRKQWELAPTPPAPIPPALAPMNSDVGDFTDDEDWKAIGAERLRYELLTPPAPTTLAPATPEESLGYEWAD